MSGHERYNYLQFPHAIRHKKEDIKPRGARQGDRYETFSRMSSYFCFFVSFANFKHSRSEIVLTASQPFFSFQAQVIKCDCTGIVQETCESSRRVLSQRSSLLVMTRGTVIPSDSGRLLSIGLE